MTTGVTVGQVLAGRYRIVAALGEGGMGAVFEAEHVELGRRVAVKLLHADLARKREVVERFHREAKIAATLDHEHVVAVTDVGETDAGVPFLVMERLQGETLRTLLAREGPLAPVRAVRLVRQACRGLVAAHARGLVHRDIKPENVFVARRADGSDWVKLLDFGVAKLSDTDAATLATLQGALVGTLGYMSPEQARGDAEIDARSDVYAVAATLYEALSGRRAHEADRPHQLLYRIIHDEPTELTLVRPELPPDLCDVVRRAMAKASSDRFDDALAFDRALAAFSGEHEERLVSTKTLPDSVDQLRATRDTTDAALALPPRGPPSRWRRGALAALAVLVVLLVLAPSWSTRAAHAVPLMRTAHLRPRIAVEAKGASSASASPATVAHKVVQRSSPVSPEQRKPAPSAGSGSPAPSVPSSVRERHPLGF